MNKEAGSHVHFEVRKDNVAVNPERYLNKSVTEIKADAGAKATNASGKKLMTNLKKKRSQRARNQKVKQKTSLKRREINKRFN